jgi:predicted  nucleic acid-binding Zn-ribbon protein
MSRVSALFRLQEIDLDLDANRARLKEIDVELGEHPTLRDAQRRVVDAEAQMQTTRINLRSLEHDQQALTEKIAEVEQRLYSGVVKNTKELQDLQKEIDFLKRRGQSGEEQQLEALIAAESAEAQIASLRSSLERIETETARVNNHLTVERDALRARVENLEGERESALASATADDVEIYQYLRQRKHGRAVSRLEDGVCAACGVAPSAARMQDARRGYELIRCGNCERILYAG